MNLRKSSALLQISLIIFLLCGIVIAYSAYNLYHGWSDYRQAEKLNTIENTAIYFSDALKNFMFVRGRTNVVLSAEEPISEENKAFLNERRRSSDEAFEMAFNVIAGKHPEEAELLRVNYGNIKELNQKVNEEAIKPLTARDSELQEIWFTAATDYINLVLARLEIIGSPAYNDYLTFNYFECIIDSIHFRSIVGQESSLFTSAIKQKGSLSDEDYRKLLMLRGQSSQIWSDIEKKVELINSEKLTEAFENVMLQYYQQFRPAQDKLLSLALNDNLYDGAGEEIANLSVPALDSIFAIGDEALEGMIGELQSNIDQAYRRFIISLLQLLFSFLIALIAPFYLNNKYIQPLGDIINRMENLSSGKNRDSVQLTERNDEIGKIAKGVEMLQNTMNQELKLKLELERSVELLEVLSTRDVLTGLYNRRYMQGRLSELEKLYLRNDNVFSVIVCDVDFFKEINDSYGHECGDEVLIEIASLLSGFCRESDVLARWGGKEFLYVLPYTDREGAKSMAERIRAELESKIYHYEENEIRTTMTFGVAEYDTEHGIDGTIRNADRVLFQGKNSGRNQVVAF